MKTTRRGRIVGVVAGAALVVGGVTGGVVAAGGGDDNEAPITGVALERASEAALEFVGEGRVTETEVDDEDAKYEVEVTRDDGSEVDVHLNADFTVVGAENEAAGEDDDGDGDDD